ncbi:AMP-binding enzyme [Stipitochalara longipes BDJ]|nr:AMP-binding enzyme [Stipitochalara longipes BDJ]
MGIFRPERTIETPTKDILSWMFDDPHHDKDEPVYIDAKDPSRSISSNQARVIIRKLIAGLHAAGLKKGDCVCVHSFNDIYYPMLFLGTVGAGGIFTGSNPAYTKPELLHHIKTSKAKFLISEPEIFDTALSAATEYGIIKSNIWVFDVLKQPLPAGFRSWAGLLNHGEEDWIRFNSEKTCTETVTGRFFSSGTTGLPKAVSISHGNWTAQITLVHENTRKTWRTRRSLHLPMFHLAIAPVAHLSPLRLGETCAVLRRFELEPFLAAIQKFSLNDVGLVPPIAVLMINSTSIVEKYPLQSIMTVTCGAAPLSKDTQSRLKTLLPAHTTVNQVWGMTESTCIATHFPYPEVDFTGSVGLAGSVPNIEIKLVDDDGKDISAFDTVGELCVRGPTITSGYFENPKANAESFDSEGFYKSGDIGYCDGKSKKWYLIDRKKELIKVRGFQVAPPEIEGVLLSHPQIVDAAVIAVKYPTEPEIEHPRAYVVKRPVSESQSLDEKAVKAWCGERLAKYKELTGGVTFVDTIPKNPSGKILKRILREMAKKESRQRKARL